MSTSSSSLARHNLRSTQIALFSLAAVFSFSVLWYWLRGTSQRAAASSRAAEPNKDEASSSSTATRKKQPREERKTPVPDAGGETKAASPSSISKDDETALHAEIEALDAKGKAFFKAKQYLDAAQSFTEALDLIAGSGADSSSSVLQRLAITLLNNRSAMYEKANLPELALEDCNTILETDANHAKARARKLKLLEHALNRPMDALVEVCASQLLHMKQHRTAFRMGGQIPPPPVSESKLQELLLLILPEAMAPYEKELEMRIKGTGSGGGAVLPSSYTIMQLLKSYAGYNAWMAEAARSGSAASIVVPDVSDDDDDAAAIANRATMLMKRGQRYAYDSRYDLATTDFEQAYASIETIEDSQKQKAVIDYMAGDSYARLMEWTGMVRHWHYNLEGSMAAYHKCATSEPSNALILVKQAGVQMDKGELEEAFKLFDTALALDSNSVDALLHRSNLRLVQGKIDEAKADLLRCLELKPNHVMARLRLASVYASQNELDNAKRQLDLAENEDPKSSDVKSHRGELYFTQNEMDEARQQFEKAIEMEPGNPTPYVNCAMTILNTPLNPGQIPDTAAIMDYLERAIEVDPQFTAAYMQLGQIALGTATDLTAAKEVIKLYDNGLANCRTKEEIRELLSMRTLALAQVDAASMLGMETFNMQ